MKAAICHAVERVGRRYFNSTLSLDSTDSATLTEWLVATIFLEMLELRVKRNRSKRGRLVKGRNCGNKTLDDCISELGIDGERSPVNPWTHEYTIKLKNGHYHIVSHWDCLERDSFYLKDARRNEGAFDLSMGQGSRIVRSITVSGNDMAPKEILQFILDFDHSLSTMRAELEELCLKRKRKEMVYQIRRESFSYGLRTVLNENRKYFKKYRFSLTPDGVRIRITISRRRLIEWNVSDKDFGKTCRVLPYILRAPQRIRTFYPMASLKKRKTAKRT